MGNTMARRQVLVQLDDELLADLDREAKRAKVNRSALIRRALGGWLEASKTARLEHQYAAGYRRIPEDPALSEAMLRFAAETAPPYDA